MRDHRIDGLLLLDKSVGGSSSRALQSVRRLYASPGASSAARPKAGHTGTLDPLASGMLVICFGRATKFAQFLLESDKVYRVTLQLGVRTVTGDSEGDVLARCEVPENVMDQVPDVLSSLTGSLTQVPPMYSAIKHKGRPLYEWARQGIEIPRKGRPVTIHEVQLLSRETPTSFSVQMRCSKGMYVRTWADDVGLALGCGAHVTALRRLSVGAFQEQDMVDWDALSAMTQAERLAVLKPTSDALQHWPVAQVDQVGMYYLRRGQPVFMMGAVFSEGQWVRIHNAAGRFLGVGSVLSDGRVSPKFMA